jgi:hypothetical protein
MSANNEGPDLNRDCSPKTGTFLHQHCCFYTEYAGMWLVTVIGSVHGQTSEFCAGPGPILRHGLMVPEFTFVLEQKRSYTLGKDKSADIRLLGRYIRPIEGKLEVGDWDPTNVCPLSLSYDGTNISQRKKPPSLAWKPEPKKNGSISPYKTIFPLDHNLLGSTDKGDYESQDVITGDTQNAHGIWFDNQENQGQGIDLGEEGWFM